MLLVAIAWIYGFANLVLARGYMRVGGIVVAPVWAFAVGFVTWPIIVLTSEPLGVIIGMLIHVASPFVTWYGLTDRALDESATSKGAKKAPVASGHDQKESCRDSYA
ncbi:hypothetical protein ACERK3_16805 [Phycisphaerales bacterium AB-hyl4]|uniref:Uncharacterized protein n=1 Tax=Natronomicrosphaera hydrolytica TaxID=3242702 RepID=A0ABV4U8T1_9BACT